MNYPNNECKICGNYTTQGSFCWECYQELRLIEEMIIEVQYDLRRLYDGYYLDKNIREELIRGDFIFNKQGDVI